MKRVWTVLFVSILALGLAALSACGGASYEGSGSKDAASAEQLAKTQKDPWDAPQSVTKDALSEKYKDGTYTGEGQGMDGWIRVTITIRGNKLTVDSIRQEGETQGVGGYEAIRDGVYAKQIEAAQGVEIDGRSGATITTAGVVSALKAALKQAAVSGK